MDRIKEKPNDPRYGPRFALLGLLCAVIFLLSFLLGRYGVPAGTVLRILWARLVRLCSFGAYTPVQTWTDTEWAAVVNIRAPRILCAFLVGAALSCAGSAYQGMFRNPMVSPDLMGASTGAGFGAALAILLGAGYFGITLSASSPWCWRESWCPPSSPRAPASSSWWRTRRISSPPSPTGSWAR